MNLIIASKIIRFINIKIGPKLNNNKELIKLGNLTIVSIYISNISFLYPLQKTHLI